MGPSASAPAEQSTLTLTHNYTSKLTDGDLQRIKDEAAYIDSVNRITQVCGALVILYHGVTDAHIKARERMET